MTESIAICFMTKERVELSRRTVEPLYKSPGDYDLLWIDGSTSADARLFTDEFFANHTHRSLSIHHGIRGGADAAIVYALTTMLKQGYDYVGIAESDVLLPADWFGPTFALFERGRAEGLEVGAVSARCYDDRILCQRDGYALCHNMGAGHLVLTKTAARLILDNYRSGYTSENRAIFAALSGIDIARYWAFRGERQFLTADWGFDATLARHGLASLALTPSPVEMIDQPLAPLGLKLADGKNELLRDDGAFAKFARRTRMIREGRLSLPYGARYTEPESGTQFIFAHQLPANWDVSWWNLQWQQGFGPFAYVSKRANSAMKFDLCGPADFMVSNKTDGEIQVEVTDPLTGYALVPTLQPYPDQIMSLSVPGGPSMRTVTLTAKQPGVAFHGIRTNHPQPFDPSYRFDWKSLPPAE